MRAVGLAGLAALAVAATTGGARAETRPGYGGKLEAALMGAPATFDPAAAQSHAEITLSELLFDTLYRIELPHGAVVPHLAAGMPAYDPTRTVARVVLRAGVKFHDGAVLAARDVAASLDRARAGAGRWALAPIASVAPDGDAVVIRLRAPGVDVATMLALAPSAVTPAGRAPGARPVGTGPFRLVSIDRAAGRLVLDAFDDHFAGRTYLDRLVLRWHDNADAEARRFELDDAQLSARGPSTFAGGQPKYRARSVYGPRALLVFVGFGRRQAAVRDAAFRRALDHAIDRGALASDNKGEDVVPVSVPVPPDVAAAPPGPAGANLAQARLALDEAARRVPALTAANRGRLILEIAFEVTRPDDRKIAERIARALRKLGIGASLSALSAGALRERVNRGTTDLWIGQLALPIKPGASWPWWSAAFAAGGDGWVTSRLGAGALDEAAARAAFASRRPIVPLVLRNILMWHRSDVYGLRFDATGRPGFAEIFLFGTPERTK